MSTVLDPPVTPPAPQPARWPRNYLNTSYTVSSWLLTTDHKRIGILYMVTTAVFFVLGGLEALLMRIQLAQPRAEVLSPETYNELFTMHGTTMIFLVVMPLLLGFANYLVPLMIGARDMAFPRLNALSYWLLLFAGRAGRTARWGWPPCSPSSVHVRRRRRASSVGRWTEPCRIRGGR